MNILNLRSLKVIGAQEIGTGYLFTVETVEKPSRCSRCGMIGAAITGHGRKQQVFQDVPDHGNQIGILVERRRYACRECGATFLEPLVEMDGRRHVTKRLLRYIQSRSITNTFTGVAGETGLDEKTVRLIFNDYVVEQYKSYRPEAPEWLGINEAWLLHGNRCALTNIKACTILDILESHDEPTVWNYLSQLSKKERIEHVCMDMWPPYRDAVKSCLPKAEIIIDKCQLIDCASAAVDAVRKSLGAELAPRERRDLRCGRKALLKSCRDLTPEERRERERWLGGFPLLRLACELKETFCEIFDACSGKAEVERRYDSWETGIDPGLRQFFSPLVASMRYWRAEIFNYFDGMAGYPVTDAYAESISRLIRQLQRSGRSYSFKALRAGILLVLAEREAPHPEADCDWMPDSAVHPEWRLGIQVPDLLLALESRGGADRPDEPALVV